MHYELNIESEVLGAACLFFDVFVIWYHLNNPVHPKFLISRTRKAVIFTHIVSGSVQCIMGPLLLGLWYAGVAPTVVMWLKTGLVVWCVLFHVTTASFLARTPFGEVRVMLPAFIFVIGMYCYEAVLRKDWLIGHTAITAEERQKNIEIIESLPQAEKWQRWKSEPFLALTTYIQLVQAFGWENWRAYLHSFADESLGPVPDTDEEALRLFESRARWKMDRNLGRIGPLFSPEEAARDYSPAEQFALQRLREGALIGSAATVGAKLRQLAARLAVQELVVITWTHDPVAQMHSYELLAQEFALAAHS
jgi:hypothetical protein